MLPQSGRRLRSTALIMELPTGLGALKTARNTTLDIPGRTAEISPPAKWEHMSRVEPGVTTRWHRLIDTCERYTIINGTGRMEIDDLPAEDVSPGDTVLIPPMCKQRISNTGLEDLVFLAICTPRFRQEAYQDCELSC